MPTPPISRPKKRSAFVALGLAMAIAVLLGSIVLLASPSEGKESKPMLEHLRLKVVKTYPHDRHAFTQGLLFHAGKLYESTGLNGRSSIREVALETGEVLRRHDLDRQYFGEGLTLVGDELYQLTWQSGKAFVYDLESFELVRSYDYAGEGWGLCYNGAELVMSDGTEWLAFRHPKTFEVSHRVRVRQESRPVRRLNELECVGGSVYANVWETDNILRIDPKSGAVSAVIDAESLLEQDERRGTDVLNGIASRGHGRFLVTGKLWPKLFEVELVPAEGSRGGG